MVPINRKKISVYEEAKNELSSLVWQTVTVFVGFIFMLLLTGGNPSSFAISIVFILGITFVAWSEQIRFTKLRFNYTLNYQDTIIFNYQEIKEMLKQFFPEESPDSNEINTSIIKIRGKTLIFINSIYQISNISSLRLLNLSTVQPFPKNLVWFVVCGFAGLYFLPLNLKVFGLISIAYAVWKFYEYQNTKFRRKYGLKISLNSGEKPIILNSDAQFLKEIMVVLYNIMNSEEPKSITFNLEDKSVKIDRMLGGNFVGGNVTGDVVNNV
jgi:hypothetical protein